MAPEAARAFNQNAGNWWSELHRAASKRAKDSTGFKGRLRARVWEKQKRGLAHVHGVLSVDTPSELAWAKSYVEALTELAPRYGFGFVDGWHKISRKFWPGDQAGAYLSSYFVCGAGRKAPITENVLAGDLPRLVVYVDRELTQRTGCTMRNLRNARRVWAWLSGLIPDPGMDSWDELVAVCLLDRKPVPAGGPDRRGGASGERRWASRRANGGCAPSAGSCACALLIRTFALVATDPIQAERERRFGLWDALVADGGTKRVPAARVNELRVFYGGRGIWVDKARTAEAGPDGITVGVQHTGLSYADDLFDDGIVYHYLTTQSPGRDAAEVAATKAAQALAIPLFVVTRPTPYSKYRNIDLGWVEAFDDDSRTRGYRTVEPVF